MRPGAPAPTRVILHPQAGRAATQYQRPADSSPHPITPYGASATLYIHVAGAVRHPGVYQLADGSRVFNAVHAAGGALPKGDTDAVNLAEKLGGRRKGRGSDQGPKRTISMPIPALRTAALKGLEEVARAVLDSLKTSTHSSSGKTTRSKRGKKSASAKSSSSHGSKITHGQININTATVAQFEQLPGVGPAMAARIVEGAKKHWAAFRKLPIYSISVGLGRASIRRLSLL